MKWESAETRADNYFRRVGKWHRWFAWYPVYTDGGDSVVWWVWVERRGDRLHMDRASQGTRWEYREVKNG